MPNVKTWVRGEFCFSEAGDSWRGNSGLQENIPGHLDTNPSRAQSCSGASGQETQLQGRETDFPDGVTSPPVTPGHVTLVKKTSLAFFFPAAYTYSVQTNIRCLSPLRNSTHVISPETEKRQ